VRLIVDASVAVKWGVAEEGHAEAIALAAMDHEFLVPDLVFVEVGNALWKKAIRGEISRQQAVVVASEIRIAFSSLLPAVELAERALSIAMELNHPIYDCVYLAAAEEYQGIVVTSDSRLLRIVASGPFASLVVSLPAMVAT
jgi:predicted nucleic acid-binding protein